MRNVELILKVANKIETEPELYNQREYFDEKKCGTVCCVAGHAALLAGAMYGYGNRAFREFQAPDGSNVWDYARKSMGLTKPQAEWLFIDYRNEEAMPKVLYALAGGANLNTLKKIEKEFI